MQEQKEKAAKRMQRKPERLVGSPTSADIETSEVMTPADETMGTAE